MSILRIIKGAFAGALLLCAASAEADTRVALVIGNSAYENVAHLSNPTNDAGLIAAALKEDGFEVTLADDLGHDGMIKALRTFGKAADGADWAVVYYAGHGIEMGATNYLVPVDAKLETDRDVGFEAVPLDQVESAIEGARTLRMVILDACRNDPFLAAMKRSGGAGRGVGRGLSIVEPEQATLVAYSAKAGSIAADGDGADSPFAVALAKHLTQPGVEVDKMFRLVRDDVLDATGKSQEPFVYGSLPGRQDFFFVPQDAGGAGSIAAPPQASAEVVFWQSIANSTRKDDFQAYLNEFPSGTFAALATTRLAALEPATSPATPPALTTSPPTRGAEPMTLSGDVDGLGSASFSPDGKRIVTSGQKTAKIWDAASGGLLVTLKGHSDLLYSAAFSPDSRHIVTASNDHTAKIWEADSGRLLVTLQDTSGLPFAAFSPDGKRIVTASFDNTPKVWDAATGSLLITLKGHTTALWSAVFSPDGTRIVTVSLDPKVWDAASGGVLATLKGHAGPVGSASFSPDGHRIVTASFDHTAKVWDAASGGLLVTLKGHTNLLERAVFSPDGSRIATASDDTTAKIWDADSGRLLATLKGHAVPVESAIFSPNGRWIATTTVDTGTKIWDADSGRLLATLEGEFREGFKEVSSAVFSPDGSRIVTIESAAKIAKVWDVAAEIAKAAATSAN